LALSCHVFLQQLKREGKEEGNDEVNEEGKCQHEEKRLDASRFTNVIKKYYDRPVIRDILSIVILLTKDWHA